MPKPVKYWKDVEIEEKAAEVLDQCVAGGRQRPQLPIDIDTLTEVNFRFKTVWEPIADPPDCQTFATLLPVVDSTLYVAKLTLNKNLFEFLAEHPEIERLTRAHELCHWLIHIDEAKLKTGLLPFGGEEPKVRYHRSQYNAGHLSVEQKNRLARFAQQSEQAYRLLKPRENDPEACIEPQWMHRQAEHFAACLLVPRQPLLRMLNDGADPTDYGTHVRLAEAFHVSKRVIQIRLKKLGIIGESADGRFYNTPSAAQLDFGT